MTFRSKAPLRISFCGGGTDVSPYYEEHGGVVLSATINKYAYATLDVRDDDSVRIHSLDYDMIVHYECNQELLFDGNLDLVKCVLNRFENRRGMDIFLHSDAPPGSGMGASSTITVALTGVMKELTGEAMTNYNISELAYQIERVDMGIKGGKQDQYAAVFGGFNLIEFRKDATIVNPLRIDPVTVDELAYHLMLCYTGKTRLSAGLIDKQVKSYIERERDTLDAMEQMKQVTYQMKDALLRGRLTEFASLLSSSWETKKQMNPDVTNEHIDHLYEKALEHGAIAGKILGAGGGGYLLLYCAFNKKHLVAKALEKEGGKFIDFEFSPKGLQVWNVIS